MGRVREEDIERLAVLIADLTVIRREVRHTSRRPPARVPELLAENVAALSAYITGAARLGAELSARVHPSAPNLGEMWGQFLAASRGTRILLQLTEMLHDAYDLANQTRPRSKTRSHFYAPGLDERQAAKFAEIDDLFGHTLWVLRDARSGLVRVMKREIEQEQQALAEPDGPVARAVAARQRAGRKPLVIVPAMTASQAAAAQRGRAGRVVSSAPAISAASPAPAVPARASADLPSLTSR